MFNVLFSTDIHVMEGVLCFSKYSPVS